MGMIGPAFSTLIVSLFSVIFLLTYGAKELHASISKLFDQRLFLVFVFKLVIVFVLCVFFKSILEDFGLPNFMLICLLGIVFILLSFFVNRKQILDTFLSINHMEG